MVIGVFVQVIYDRAIYASRSLDTIDSDWEDVKEEILIRIFYVCRNHILRRVDDMDVEEIQDGVLKLKWSKIYISCECLWRCSGHGNDRRIGQMATRFSFGEFRPRRDASKLF